MKKGMRKTCRMRSSGGGGGGGGRSMFLVPNNDLLQLSYEENEIKETNKQTNKQPKNGKIYQA